MILLLWQFDPEGDKNGGIGKYVLSFVKGVPSDVRVGIVGLTSDRDKVGLWQSINIESKTIPFFPIGLTSAENNKNKFPTLLKMLIGLYKYRRDVGEGNILFHQRIEYSIPLLSVKNTKHYTIVHTDIEKYLDKSKSEALWSRFPFLYNILEKLLISRNELVFSVSCNTIDHYISRYPKKSSAFFFAPTWYDRDVFSERNSRFTNMYIKSEVERLRRSESERLLVFVGRMQEEKNVDMILNVLSSLPNNIKLIIAGDGNLLEKAKNNTYHLKISERVSFLGSVEHKDIPALYHTADLTVSTSFFEGMSIALLESLAMGTPVVTTPTGESRRIIIDGDNGYISTGWDIEEFQCLIIKALFETSFSSDIVRNTVKHFDPNIIVRDIISNMSSAYDK